LLSYENRGKTLVYFISGIRKKYFVDLQGLPNMGQFCLVARDQEAMR
jgi:hypothetical protein